MQTTMLIDIENYRVLLLGACRPREKYYIFFPALPIAFPYGIYVFTTMSEPGVEGKIIVKKCSEKIIIKRNEK